MDNQMENHWSGLKNYSKIKIYKRCKAKTQKSCQKKIPFDLGYNKTIMHTLW